MHQITSNYSKAVCRLPIFVKSLTIHLYNHKDTHLLILRPLWATCLLFTWQEKWKVSIVILSSQSQYAGWWYSLINFCIYRLLLGWVSSNAPEIDNLWGSCHYLKYLFTLSPQIWIWLAGCKVTNEGSLLTEQTVPGHKVVLVANLIWMNFTIFNFNGISDLRNEDSSEFPALQKFLLLKSLCPIECSLNM